MNISLNWSSHFYEVINIFEKIPIISVITQRWGIQPTLPSPPPPSIPPPPPREGTLCVVVIVKSCVNKQAGSWLAGQEWTTNQKPGQQVDPTLDNDSNGFRSWHNGKSQSVKNCVNFLSWLLIGCSAWSSQSGASLLVDPTLDHDTNS